MNATIDLFTNNALAPGERKTGEIAGYRNDDAPLARDVQTRPTSQERVSNPVECSTSSAEQAAGEVGPSGNAEATATRTSLARAAGLEEELPENPLVPITEDQWARILDGRKVRWLVKPVHIEWAGKRAVSCGNCVHTNLHGDPRRGWCTEHRMLVSLAFTLLCREHTQS
jgi:hypothetical protein